MELLIATPAGHAVPSPPFIPARMAYRIGNGPKLLGIRIPSSSRGGLMMIDSRDFDGRGDPSVCCRQVLGECKRRGYQGIVCDFEGPPVGCLPKLVEILARNCTNQGWSVYVPEAFAYCSVSTKILISSALTSGTLERRLQAAVSSYASRVTLAVEWLREDFLLPASGRGSILSQTTLEEQIRRLEPAVFFDRGLCAHYYTYMTEGQAHFVLFDTPRSIREKLLVGRRVGVTSALLPGPEVSSCLDEIRI